MPDYERLSTAEVLALARRGDKDALFDMAYRVELLPSGRHSANYEQLAWKEYWMEKARQAGHTDAQRVCANILKNLPFDAAYRKKALFLYLRFVEECDLLSGKTRDDEWNIAAVRIEAGIMLCEGLGTRRNVKEGLALISRGEEKLNQMNGMGFQPCFNLGRLYSLGFAQEGEEPSISDLTKAIQYLEMAVNRFNPARDNPASLDMARQFLGTQRERRANKEQLKELTGQEPSTIDPGAAHRRAQLEQPVSDAAKQFLAAFKTAKQRLREREDW